jgi:hypothetical protein
MSCSFVPRRPKHLAEAYLVAIVLAACFDSIVARENAVKYTDFRLGGIRSVAAQSQANPEKEFRLADAECRLLVARILASHRLESEPA